MLTHAVFGHKFYRKNDKLLNMWFFFIQSTLFSGDLHVFLKFFYKKFYFVYIGLFVYNKFYSICVKALKNLF